MWPQRPFCWHVTTAAILLTRDHSGHFVDTWPQRQFCWHVTTAAILLTSWCLSWMSWAGWWARNGFTEERKEQKWSRSARLIRRTACRSCKQWRPPSDPLPPSDSLTPSDSFPNSGALLRFFTNPAAPPQTLYPTSGAPLRPFTQLVVSPLRPFTQPVAPPSLRSITNTQ